MSISLNLRESDVGDLDVDDITALRQQGLSIEDAVDIALELDNPDEVLAIAHDGHAEADR